MSSKQLQASSSEWLFPGVEFGKSLFLRPLDIMEPEEICYNRLPQLSSLLYNHPIRIRQLSTSTDLPFMVIHTEMAPHLPAVCHLNIITHPRVYNSLPVIPVVQKDFLFLDAAAWRYEPVAEYLLVA